MSVSHRFRVGSADVITWTWEQQLAVSASRRSIKLVGVGKYSVLVANPPPIGQQGPMPAGYLVDDFTLSRTQGDLGRMEVNGSMIELQLIDVETDVEQELDWGRMDRPLIVHPIWDYDEDTWDPAYGLSIEDRCALQAWESEPNAGDREAYHYRLDLDSAATETLSDDAQEYAKKRLAGIDFYAEYIPILRRRSSVNRYSSNLVNNSGLAKRWTPAQIKVQWLADPPTGWEWLKTADSWSKTGRHGKWKRNVEWTGMRSWDHDLYQPYVETL